MKVSTVLDWRVLRGFISGLALHGPAVAAAQVEVRSEAVNWGIELVSKQATEITY